MEYDAFSNLTERHTTTWGDQASMNDIAYANNRKTSGGLLHVYDNAGNVVDSGYGQGDHTTTWYDAAGRSQRWEELGPWGPHQKKGGENLFDGDGQAVKTTDLVKNYVSGNWEEWNETDSYHLYSSVTKQKIIDLDPDGVFSQFHVYYSGTEIANGDDEALTFHVVDPITGSFWKTDGNTFPVDDKHGSNAELAGLQKR